MLLSVTEAAKVAGCARSTIYEKINAGQLSRSSGGKIDTAELQRVFGELQAPVQQQSNDVTLQNQPDIVLSAELLDMVQAKDSELADIRAELSDTRKRLDEHREAARALIDPETFEAKQAQWQSELESVKVEQAKKESDWHEQLAERHRQIEQARIEADEIRQREQQAQRELDAMQNRGLIDRLFNRKPELI